MTFEQFRDKIGITEGLTLEEKYKVVWDAAYAEGHTDGLLKHIRSEYDYHGKETSNTGTVI